MATNLKTDYKDYIPPESGKRYITTTDYFAGYSTIQDATEYTQEGDTFSGANDINTTNNTINNLTAARWEPYQLRRRNAGSIKAEGQSVRRQRTSGRKIRIRLPKF